MSQKAIVNIVYAPQKKPPHKVFENDQGEIWRSSSRTPNKINVGMGWYSIKKPQPHDSIWVVEPYCVLERDYQTNFLKGFKYIFTWATKAFEQNNKIKDRVIEIHHPTYHNVPNDENLTKNWKSWNERSNEIVFIANNKSSKHHSELYSLRLQLADLLYKKSKYKVSWYGQIPIKRSYFKGTIHSKQEILTNVKFSVCTENSYDPVFTHGYFTEKMPDVWLAGTVPIYMGCYNINDYNFQDVLYIDLRKFVKKVGKQFKINENALINQIENFSEQKYQNFQNKIINKLINSQKLKQITSFDSAYEKIVKTFYDNMLRNGK